MDITISSQLGKLIKQITETGEWNLDPDNLKSIKSICKRSDVNVEVAFDYWFAQLKKDHAQIRYSCVQLAEQLFQRSHQFRLLLTGEFPQFISLTVGDRQRSLPPPEQVALKLKQYTLALVSAWNEKFANKYRPIAIAFDYLQHNGVLVANHPSLDSIHSQNDNRANQQSRMQPVYERRLQQISNESEEYLPLIHENLQQMEGCFEILLPKYDDGSEIDFDALMKGDIDSSKAITQQDQNKYREDLRSHGLGSSRYKLEIVISKNPVADEVHESKENEVVFEQLREGYKVARRKHNKQLTTWINSLGRMELQNNENRNLLLKKLLEVKAEITETIRKSELLGIQLPSKEEGSDDGDDDEYLDELFEEIDVPSSSSSRTRRTRSKLPPARRIFPLAFEPGMEDDVTYKRVREFSQTEKKDEQESSKNEISLEKRKGKGKAAVTPDKEELLKKAPVVEWGEDLYYWDKNDAQFNTSGIERSHRFMGVGEGTNEIPDQLLEQLRKRTIYYKPQMPQHLKTCRAPLRSGKLCPRRDLVTCPFHGKIIPRDEYGIPVNSEVSDNPPGVSSSSYSSTLAVSSPQQQYKNNPTLQNEDTSDLWQDIERDVMQQVDQPLIEVNKRKRKRNKPRSNLVDVRKKKETSYTRLQKKLETAQMRHNVEEAEDYERTIKSRDQKMNTW